MNGFIEGLAPETGANANYDFSGKFTIPLPNGKSMYITSFNSSFSKKFSKLCPQPLGTFESKNGNYFNHRYYQSNNGGGGLPRLLVSAPIQFYDLYSNAYYQ